MNVTLFLLASIASHAAEVHHLDLKAALKRAADMLLAGMKERRVRVLTGLGALYGLFDLQAGSDGFNTGFAFPEVLSAMVHAAREGDWDRARSLYLRFLPLIVFEQQPGVAVRKEVLRRRGLIESGAVRHPGGPLPPGAAEQLDALLSSTLGDIDLTRPIRL